MLYCSAAKKGECSAASGHRKGAIRMIIKKSPAEIEAMKEAGRISAKVLREVGARVQPGVSTLELDEFAETLIRLEGGTPAFKGYGGFPGSICASVNEQIVHGIPSASVILKEGDIISINIPEHKLDLEVSNEVLEERRKSWKPRQPKITTGYLARYAKLVSSGTSGAVLS